MIFELLKLDLDLSLQLPSEISSLVTRMVQHDLKYSGTNICSPGVQRKWQFSDHTSQLSLFHHQFQPISTSLDRNIRNAPFYSYLKTSMWSQKDTWLAVMKRSKKLNNIKVITQKSGFLVFWVLQFRVTCFLNEHWKPVVQHKPFKKQQRWRSYCMNIATQDHLASKTFYCFETVHKVIKNSNGLCQKSIQRRRGKGRTEKEQWK